MTPADSMAQIAAEVSQCAACPLARSRTHPVPGEGAVPARLMVIGEGPGRQEDEAGRPFVGAAGQLLDRMLQAIHLDRSQVFIANVVKCRPPQNRTPTDEEIEACAPFLARQIALVDPDVILVLGATAAKALLGARTRITQIRGQWQAWGQRAVMPTYHPAYLLRDPRQKVVVWEDLRQVADRLGIPL
jgi:uracil-DNA glycosylase family 4